MPRLEAVVQVVDGDVTSVKLFQELEAALNFGAAVVCEQLAGYPDAELAAVRRELRISREWRDAGFAVYVLTTTWGPSGGPAPRQERATT